MKKVLFATTALIATASMAAADVRISGYGRFGLDYNEANDRDVNGVSETTITSRLRIQFDMSTETDGGVVFSARTRAQAESRDNSGASGPITALDTDGDGNLDSVEQGGGAIFNGARFGVGYNGLQVNVGNIIGAIEGMSGLYLETRTAGIGIDGAGFESLVTNVNGEAFNWDAYSSAGFGANGVEVLYSAGGFSGHISYSQDNATIASRNNGDIDRTAVNVAYTFGDWTAALGYQDSSADFEEKVVFTIAGDIGNFGVRFAYADNDGIDKFGLYGSYEIGAASKIVAFVTDEDEVSAADVAAGRTDNNTDGTGYGIHYSYDLGGGASFEAGWRESSSDNTTVQAGVYFSF